jgi:endonuclease/exonuclease/phosphatase family metal-dependent hydrolase
MKLIGKIITYPILFVNIVAAVLLLVCSYSSLAAPKGDMPLTSLSGLAFPIFLIINILFIIFWLLFWTKGSLISIVTFVICIGPCLDYFPLNFKAKNYVPKEKDIKIISYNTEAFGTKVNKDWGNTNPLLAYITSQEADIICLQEAIVNVIAQKGKDKNFLPDYPYYAYSSIGNIACLSKYPIIHSEGIGFEGVTGNSYLYCKILINNDTLAVYNCHLESNRLSEENIDQYWDFFDDPTEKEKISGPKTVVKKLITSCKARAAQAEIISDKIKAETAKYTIVCGDLNDTPLSYTHKLFEKDLHDAHSTSGFGAGISYHKHHLYYRIDHIFTSKSIKSRHCWIDNSIKDSDHYPICAVLTLNL